MNRHSINDNSANPRRRLNRRRAGLRRRKGWVTIVLIISIGMILGIIALVWTAIWLSVTHQHFRTRCEAGALAGASRLMDDSCLYGSSDTYGDLEVRLGAARAEATYWMNQNGESVVQIDQNEQENDPDRGLAFGMVDAATAPDRTFTPWVVNTFPPEPVNTIRTHIERSEERGDALVLWCAKSLGLMKIDMNVSAQATLDQRVFGFRPIEANAVNVPMVPILVGQSSWNTNWRWPTNGEDKAAWNPGQNKFDFNHPDGDPAITDNIVEAKLTFNSDQLPPGPLTNNKLGLLGLDGNPPVLAQIATQIANGLTVADLGASGKVSLDYPAYPMVSELSVGDLNQLKDWLNNLAASGEERIWPIGNSVGSSSTAAEIQGFAAARVVNAKVEDDENGKKVLIVRLQPCLIQTCTALTRSNAPLNPYIGRVVLTR